MEIFLLLSVIILMIFFTLKKAFYSAKKHLFKDQVAWFGKDINIKYTKSKESSELKKNENYLKIIADESKLYLQDQTKKDEK